MRDKSEKIKNKKSGFTLLETVVAVGILIAASVGPVALVTQSLFSFPFAKNKLIALNLAQEGVELIRAIRDNNMLCVVFAEAPSWNWDRDHDGDSSKTLRGWGIGRMFDAVNDTSTITCSGPGGTMNFKNPGLNPGDCRNTKLQVDSNGRYGYGLAGGVDTIFTRCVKAENPSSADPGSIPTTDMLDVTSLVEWSDHGISRSVSLKTRLYNWQKP